MNTRQLVVDNSLDIKKEIEIMERFRELRRTEDMGVILETQIEGIQTHAEEMLDQKDKENRQ